MLTPSFELTQDDEFLIVAIQAPYAKASEVEVHFEDNDFMFYSKPYYLRLNLPGKVSFTEDPSVKYDFDKRIFRIYAPKVKPGEVFEGLDLVTLLLAPKKNKTSARATPLIEVIDASDNASEDEEELDWTTEQLQSEDKFGEVVINGQQCGFVNSYAFAVFRLKEETAEIFDVLDPESKTPAIRSKERTEAEDKKFSEDHYVADLYHDELVQTVMGFSPEWDTVYSNIQNRNPETLPDDIVHFTGEEKERLKKLPFKEYLLDKEQLKMAFLSLTDILFAFAYDKRTMEGESTPESAWTINKLSATLSWLEVFSSIPQVTIACIRRSLIYPLYRHFELALTVLEDVRKILLCGRKYVIKCLLDIHKNFNASEPRYILNDLFITDYIVWMQTKSCSTSKLAPLAKAIEKILLTKGDIGLNLVDVESFAKVAWMTQQPNEENANISKDSVKPQQQNIKVDADQLSTALGKLRLEKSNDDSSDSESELCSTCSSDSSSECSGRIFSDTVDDDDESDSDESTHSLILRDASSRDGVAHE